MKKLSKELNLQKFKRKDQMINNKIPYISIRPNTIAFNSEFVKLAELKKYKRTSVFLDQENYVAAFQFHSNNEKIHSFSLYTDSKTEATRNIAVRQVLNEHRWINAISRLKDPLLKRFEPQYDNIKKLWLIYLCPSFENRVNRALDIPPEIKGVYRYSMGNEIVYIGRGDVRLRANSPDRANWEYDNIEYSIVDDHDKQCYWETVWLDRFVEEHGRLPIYNSISGKKIDKKIQ